MEKHLQPLILANRDAFHVFHLCHFMRLGPARVEVAPERNETLWMRSLPFNAAVKMVRKFFQSRGFPPIETRMNSRGSAWVRFRNGDTAHRAKELLNGTVMGYEESQGVVNPGRAVVIEFAKSQIRAPQEHCTY